LPGLRRGNALKASSLLGARGGQARVIAGMQHIIYAYTVIPDPHALSDAVAEVRWRIADGVREFQAMLAALKPFRSGLPNNAPAEDEPAP
jgi:hypothetical protein